MNSNIANEVSRSLGDILGGMNETIRLVMDNSSPEEFVAYRTAMGKVMGALIHEVINPHYEKYPETQSGGAKK